MINFCANIACEYGRFSSLLSRETSLAARSKERRLYSRANMPSLRAWAPTWQKSRGTDIKLCKLWNKKNLDFIKLACLLFYKANFKSGRTLGDEERKACLFLACIYLSLVRSIVSAKLRNIVEGNIPRLILSPTEVSWTIKMSILALSMLQ